MDPRLSPGTYVLVNGLCALIASLLIWKLTGNFWGWIVLFAPGAGMVFYGWWRVFKGD